MIGVGLAGFGLAGRYLHAPLIAAAGMKIRAVATSRADEVAAALPGADVVADAAALNARGDIDLVVIATPNALHVPQAEAALRAGKHVVVDKPAAPTAAEARALARLAEAEERMLAVYHNRRWDADFLTAKAMLDKGALGAVKRFENRWLRHRPEAKDRWREKPGPGAGLFFDLGPHLIDQAMVLFGKPDWVLADIFAQRAGAAEGVDDGFELLLGKGDLRIVIGASSFAAGPPRLMRLDAEAGSLELTGFDPQEPQLRAGDAPTDPGFGDGDGAVTARFCAPDRTPEAAPVKTGRWLTFYEGVRRSIESGSPPPVSADETADVIAVIEAAFESARAACRVGL